VHLRPCATDLGFWAEIPADRVAAVQAEGRKPVLASGCAGTSKATNAETTKITFMAGFRPQANLQLGHEGLRFHLEVLYTGHVANGPLDFIGFGAQRCQIGSEGAHNDGRTSTGEHLLDALLQDQVLTRGTGRHDALT
jgi:hypothetical protein